MSDPRHLPTRLRVRSQPKGLLSQSFRRGGRDAAVWSAHQLRLLVGPVLGAFAATAVMILGGILHAGAAAAAPGDPSGDVVSLQVNADGSGTMTTYTPPQGLPASDLHAALSKQGVTGMQVLPSAAASPTTDATTAALTSCRYGTATLFRCTSDSAVARQVHWANNGYSHPQVYFVDHTGSQWPVTTSTAVWNRAVGIDSTYVWGSCPGYAGIHCVNVVDANYGNSCWQGLTTISWNSAYNLTSARVQLNDYNGGGTCNGVAVTYAKNANGYRQDACHEMGHALGMGHNSASSGTCLYGTIINSAAVLQPSSQDFTLIARLYSTRH